MVTFFQILPLFLVTSFFLILPIITILVVSFWEYTEYSLVPDFVLTNYIELFESKVTYKIYLNTIECVGPEEMSFKKILDLSVNILISHPIFLLRTQYQYEKLSLSVTGRAIDKVQSSTK